MEKAADAEKKLRSIMDKLISSSSSSAQLSRGKKRPSTTSILALGDTRNEEIQVSVPLAGSSQAPLCRPWDRRDLMRRLSTFKSMTWFAKPEVVSAINCARRGWVNVDMDILACEQCGARLLFSSPSSWSREQVEKAALVFSLKLDNGHKLLCEWINNACNEKLAQFPPSTPQVLVDQFKERSSLLVQLVALPVSSATDLMKSTQLDQFLEQTSLLELCGNVPPAVSSTKFVGEGEDAEPALLYYQALKLITLCGWEPRVLPYLVETSRSKSSPSVEDLTISDSARPLAEESCESFSQPDPRSVVLVCNLCGARVGLWAFCTVPRPVEFFRFVGFTEIQNETDSGANGSVNHSCGDKGIGVSSIISNGVASSRPVPSNLNLSIAGGPPPREQNFKAKISLPVIGRSIRSRISMDTYIRNSLYSNQSSNQPQLGGNTQDTEKSTGPIHPSLSDNTSPLLNSDISEKRDTSNTDPRSNVLSSPNRSSNIPENVVVPGSASADADIRDPSGCSIGSQLPEADISNEVNVQIASDTGIACSQVPSSRDAGEQAVVQDEATTNGKMCPDVLNTSAGKSSMHSSCGIGDNRKVSSKNELVTYSAGNMSQKLRYDKGVHFDPFRQHRHFCPWIVSIAGGVPGWQQTLSAILRQKEVSHSSPTNSLSSASLIQIDDPISSVRRLFSSKRMKHSDRST